MSWNQSVQTSCNFVLQQASNPSAQNEEEKLRRKLSELAGNLSDKGPSSDDEAGKKSFSVGKGLTRLKGGPAIALNSRKDKELSSSSDEMPTEAQKVGRPIQSTVYRIHWIPTHKSREWEPGGFSDHQWIRCSNFSCFSYKNLTFGSVHTHLMTYLFLTLFSKNKKV